MDKQTPIFPLSSWAKTSLEAVQKELQEALPAVLQPLWERYGYDLPGHEAYPIRPYLLLLVARHYGCSEQQAYRLAASIHMSHIASLLHDQLSAEIFRQAKDGEVPQSPQALNILLGDFFFSKASYLIVTEGNVRVIKDNIQTSCRSAEIQATLISLDEKLDTIQPGDCFDVVVDKVALLFGLGLRTGAVLGKASEQEEKDISEYGSLFGRAFKIVQDFEFWHDLPELSHGALMEKRFSHPLILLWEKEGRSAWRRAVGPFSLSDKGALLELKTRLNKDGYINASINTAGRLAGQAADQLNGLTESEWLNTLKEISRKDLLKGWQ